MNILVPMAGDNRLFEESGYAFPKNLVEIAGRPLLEHVIDQFTSLIDAGANLVCLVRETENAKFHTADVVRLLYPSATVVPVPVIDTGAACTALLAIEHLDPDEPLLVFNGDQMLRRDFAEIVDAFEERKLDAGVVVFDAVHPRWSYVKLDEDGNVIEAAEKRPISRNATAGTYWYRVTSDFLAAVMAMIRKDAHVDGRFYICPAFNELVLLGRKIGAYQVQPGDYRSLATPQDVAAYAEDLGARIPGGIRL